MTMKRRMIVILATLIGVILGVVTIAQLMAGNNSPVWFFAGGCIGFSLAYVYIFAGTAADEAVV